MHLAILDVAAGLDHLEPAQLAQGLRCPGNRPLDRVVDAFLGRADDLNDTIDVIFHVCLHCEPSLSAAIATALQQYLRTTGPPTTIRYPTRALAAERRAADNGSGCIDVCPSLTLVA